MLTGRSAAAASPGRGDVVLGSGGASLDAVVKFASPPQDPWDPEVRTDGAQQDADAPAVSSTDGAGKAGADAGARTDASNAAPASKDTQGELNMGPSAVEPAANNGKAAGADGKDKAAPVVTAAAGKGVTIATPDGKYSFQIRARVQLRESVFADEGEVRNEIGVRTLRLILGGNVLSKDLSYRIQFAFGARDFEAGNASPIFDAHVDYTRLKNLSIRAGQFFVPFDRARTTREFALQLVDRQQVIRELTLDRDAGVALYSNDLFSAKERLGYSIFVGGGEGRNRLGPQRPGALVVARFVVKPWGNFDDDSEGDLDRRKTPKLALGVAGAYNFASSRVSSTYGSDFVLGTVDQVHGAADLVWKWRGWSLTAEGVVRRALLEELRGLVDGVPSVERTRSGYGYFVQSGVMVHRMVELVARWDDLYAWRGTDPAFVELTRLRGRQAVGGLNVYVNGHALKVQADYSYGFGQDSGPGGNPGAHTVRLQLDASF